MNRNEIVDAVAARADVPRTHADAVLAAFADVVGDALAAGEKVQIPGFLTAEAVERAARTGRNPRTGETLQIAASTGVKLSPGSRLKAAVAG
ncbi:MAG: HU family DNA-binding protein [Actinomycetota bacterium]